MKQAPIPAWKYIGNDSSTFIVRFPSLKPFFQGVNQAHDSPDGNPGGDSSGEKTRQSRGDRTLRKHGRYDRERRKQRNSSTERCDASYAQFFG